MMKNKKLFYGILIVVVLSIVGISLFAYLNKSIPLSTRTIEQVKEFCDVVNPCPAGKECYNFEDEDKPICWKGDPCQKCISKKCIVAESYPMQVFCQ